MTISIKTGAAFERRLAELAWESADDVVRASITNAIALQFRSNDNDYMESLASKVSDSVVESATKAALSSMDLETTTKEVLVGVQKRMKSDEYQESLLAEHIVAAKRRLTNVILEGARRAIAPRILEKIVEDAINEGIASALLAILEPIRSGINHDFFNAIGQAIRRIEKVTNQSEEKGARRKIVEQVKTVMSSEET